MYSSASSNPRLLSYTRNSVTEKILLAILDKTRLELNLGTTGVNTANDDEPEFDPEEEGCGEG